jgi:hypothetical protein
MAEKIEIEILSNVIALRQANQNEFERKASCKIEDESEIELEGEVKFHQ